MVVMLDILFHEPSLTNDFGGIACKYFLTCRYMDQNAGVRGRKLALCISLRSLHTHGSIAMREIAPAYHHLEALPATQIISIEPMDVSGVVRFLTRKPH